jgi:succinyl-CoA synthetase beta subunit
MNIHEYQAKRLFADNGIPVLEGYLARSPIEAEFAFHRLGGAVAVVKAQVHAGGRGKGGGVKLVKSADECRETATRILGMKLVTPQTGAEGKLVRKVYVEGGCKIAKEYYLAMLVDRENGGICVMFSTEGGMDIEEVAHKHPDKIIKVVVDPIVGLRDVHIRKIVHSMKLSPAIGKELSTLVKGLYKVFHKYDCSLLEINPLVETAEGKLIALDAKMNFDDNGLERQPLISELRDFDEEDSREIEASKWGLSYIGLDGSIGCLVNGAGLAMATMDIVKFYGGEPANFLDVGGGASQESVTAAFRLLFSDPKVKAVFVNIFGGIMRCDLIANGIVATAGNSKVPLVVRLEGTNVEIARKTLAESNLKIIYANNMAEGAEKVVAAARN